MPSAGFINRLIVAVTFFIGEFLFFEFGSWRIILGKQLSIWEAGLVNVAAKYGELHTDKTQSFIVNKDMALLRVNKKYFGVLKDDRYFDSPIIQWIMIVVSVWRGYFTTVRPIY